MDSLLQDLRYAVRQLARSRGFTLAAVLTLALGIGPNTAIFSLIYGLLLRPLPYERAEQLVQATWLFQSGGVDALTATQYTYWAERQRSFEGVAAFVDGGAGYNLETAGQPEYIRGRMISAGLMGVLGVRPELGRAFVAEEDMIGGPPSVMISWSLWQRRFNASTDVIGRPIPINGSSHTVVGVMPRAFQFGSAANDVWFPLRLQVNPRDQGHNTSVIARLREGVSLDQAQAEAPAIFADLRRENPTQISEGERGMVLKPYREVLVSDVRPTILLLFGAVGLVVLIAVANATGLFLGRAASRRQEVAVRAALGASRWAIIRPMVTEGVLLAVAGGIIGLGLASWTLDLVIRVFPRGLESAGTISLDAPVLLGTLGLSLAAGGLVGLIPAWQISAGYAQRTLQESGRTLGGVGQRFRTALVVGEVALSTVLLAGAALLIVSLSRLWNVQPGFDPRGVTVMQTSLPGVKFPTAEAISQFEGRVIERLTRLPGVQRVAVASSVPFERGLNGGVYGNKNGQQISVYTQQRIVSPGYFTTLGILLLRGRAVDERDTRSAARAIVINESLARAFSPDGDLLGQTLLFNGVPHEVVGVCADVREQGLDNQAPRTIYVPQAQVNDRLAVMINAGFPTSFLIKSEAPIDRPTLERVMVEVDPSQPIAGVRTMEEVTAARLAPRRLVGLLLEMFAGLAVVLAAVGLYGVVAFSVSRRRREIGLRMALGATQSAVLQLVLGQGLRLALLGTGIGLVGALASTRALRGFLFGVEATNPLVLGVAGAGLVLVALLASYLPALGATRVDPMVALRAE